MQQTTLLENIVTQLKPIRGVQAIVLGGSYASGMYHLDSDIDIAIYYGEAQLLDTAHVRTIAMGMNDTPHPIVTDIGGWGPWVNGGVALLLVANLGEMRYNEDQATIKECQED